MGLTAHLYSRFAAFGAGFCAGFGIFVAYVLRRPHDEPFLTALLFFGLLFGGGFLAQLGFVNLFPAACPKCGQKSAVPPLRQPFVYACRSCGAESNAFAYMNVELLASMPTPEQEAKRELGFSWIFLVVGLAFVGAAVWFGKDSIRLWHEGVSTQAQVMRVSRQATRDSDGNSQTSYTALIEYKVGKNTLTLERGWSVKSGSHCLWPCYDQGEMLKVIYLPGEPTRAEVHSIPGLFMLPAILGGVGALFAVFGFIMVRQRLPRRPKLEL